VPDLTRLHAHEMAALLRSGEISSRALTEAHLAASERQNRALNGWLAIYSAGLPIALKDLVSVKGGQCTAGSRILEGYIAPYDAHITEALLRRPAR
jgi:aspartyl-tRNA(Asn)/glutamyl-tRNA(Gln) amidotransferase subunit A